MRMLLTVRIPHPEFNAAVRDGTAGQKMGRILEKRNRKRFISRRRMDSVPRSSSSIWRIRRGFPFLPNPGF